MINHFNNGYQEYLSGEMVEETHYFIMDYPIGYYLVKNHAFLASVVDFRQRLNATGFNHFGMVGHHFLGFRVYSFAVLGLRFKFQD